MKLIGFNFTKISAQKSEKFNQEYSTNTNIDIANITEQTMDFLKEPAVKISFKFTVFYTPKGKETPKMGELVLEGDILFSAQAEEAKDIQKSWKKKDEKSIPIGFKVPLFNLILKKCTPKSLELEDSLGLPPHLPMPSLKATAKPDSKSETKPNKTEDKK